MAASKVRTRPKGPRIWIEPRRRRTISTSPATTMIRRRTTSPVISPAARLAVCSLLVAAIFVLQIGDPFSLQELVIIADSPVVLDASTVVDSGKRDASLSSMLTSNIIQNDVSIQRQVGALDGHEHEEKRLEQEHEGVHNSDLANGVAAASSETIHPVSSQLLPQAAADAFGSESSCPSRKRQANETNMVDCTIDTDSYAPLSLAQCDKLQRLRSIKVIPIASPFPPPPPVQPDVRWHARDFPEIQDRARARRALMLHFTKAVDDPGLLAAALRPRDSATSVAVLRDAIGEVRSGRVLTCDGTVVQFHQCNRAPDEEFPVRRTPQRTFREAIFVSGSWTHNFYHGFVEYFSRLCYIRDLLKARPDMPIVINKEGSEMFLSFAKQILDLPENRFVILPKRAVFRAKTLYVPEPTPCDRLQPAEANIIQNVFAEKLNSTTFQSNILLIRRRDPRALSNHDQLESALRAALPSESFAVFDADRLPEPGLAQLQVFADAKVVVGPHGAGLSNLLGSRPGAAVVELLADGDKFNLCFLMLSVVLGLEHHPLAMRAGEEGYTVDVPYVVDIVSEIVHRKNEQM